MIVRSAVRHERPDRRPERRQLCLHPLPARAGREHARGRPRAAGAPLVAFAQLTPLLERQPRKTSASTSARSTRRPREVLSKRTYPFQPDYRIILPLGLVQPRQQRLLPRVPGDQVRRRQRPVAQHRGERPAAQPTACTTSARKHLKSQASHEYSQIANRAGPGEINIANADNTPEVLRRVGSAVRRAEAAVSRG
jgi:hypothetical protein